MYRDTINERSHQEQLSGAMCDNCGLPATKWFGSTSVRICNSSKCRDKFQKEMDEICSKDED